MKNFLNGGYSLVVEGMFDRIFKGQKFLIRLINICKRKKVNVEVIELESSLDYILKLVRKRALKEKNSDNDPGRIKERYLRFSKSKYSGAININVENKTPDQISKLIMKKL